MSFLHPDHLKSTTILGEDIVSEAWPADHPELEERREAFLQVFKRLVECDQDVDVIAHLLSEKKYPELGGLTMTEHFKEREDFAAAAEAIDAIEAEFGIN